MTLPEQEDGVGFHNKNLEASRDRLIKGRTYKDLSTVMVVPTRAAGIAPRVVQSWMGLMTPMNQKFMRIMVMDQEVGEAYNTAIDGILNHPELSTWKYIVTLEDDNMPPPDGLLKLYEDMEFADVVGGLYWTKGEGGQPMIYGDPFVMPKNFIPQLPKPGTIQRCNGVGMGFTMFKLDIFRKVPKPWFKTAQEFTPGVGSKCYTQDLYFCEQAAKLGVTFAVDTRCQVGHFERERNIVW